MSDFLNRMFNQTMVPNTPGSSRKMTKMKDEEIMPVPIREMPMIPRNDYIAREQEREEDEEDEEDEDLFDLDVNDEDVKQVRENSLALVGEKEEEEEEEEVASPENKYCFY